MNRYSAANHTFVICAYKESEYLEECIRSVLSQKMLGEVIITTATPNEHIANLSTKYQIPLFINENGGEISKDWNFGLERAKTELVTIVHQDDIYEPEYLCKVLEGINSFVKPLIAFTDYGEIREGKKVTDNTLLQTKRFMLLPMHVHAWGNSKFIRRRILSFGSAISCPAVTYVKENLPLPIFESGFRSDLDWQAWEKISRQNGAFVYCRDILMYHRIHEDSATTEIIGDSGRTKEDFQMFCKFWPKWIAEILIKFYVKSQDSNAI